MGTNEADRQRFGSRIGLPDVTAGQAAGRVVTAMPTKRLLR